MNSRYFAGKALSSSGYRHAQFHAPSSIQQFGRLTRSVARTALKQLIGQHRVRLDGPRAWLFRLESELSGAGVNVCRSTNELRIRAITQYGLPIFIVADPNRATVALGSWYDDFYSFDSLRSVIMAAIKGDVRLRIDMADGRPFRWVVERAHEHRWAEENVMESAFRPSPAAVITSRVLSNGPAV